MKVTIQFTKDNINYTLEAQNQSEFDYLQKKAKEIVKDELEQGVVNPEVVVPQNFVGGSPYQNS